MQTRLLSVLLNEMDGIGLKTLERRGAEKVLQAEGVEQHTQEEVRSFENVPDSSTTGYHHHHASDIMGCFMFLTVGVSGSMQQ